MLIDYHTHHERCGHAAGKLEDYVRQAIQLGIKQLGLSDHMPLLHVDPITYYPEMAMPKEELPKYVEECMALKQKYAADIDLRIGLEGDYIEGWETQIGQIVRQYDWDYVIGSVHFLGEWDISDFRQVKEWQTRDTAEVYKQYYDAIAKAAASGLYTYIGHIDLVKRFGYHPAPEWDVQVQAWEKQALESIKRHDLAIEINTNGLRSKAAEAYPSTRILNYAFELGIPVTFGSDAHQPAQLGQYYEEAKAMLTAAGYSQWATFKQRQREMINL